MIIFQTRMQRHYRKLEWAAHMSHVLSLQNMSPSRDIFTIITKRLIFYSKLNFGDTNSCYRRKWNVSARRSGKKVIARTNNYSKSDSGKGSNAGCNSGNVLKNNSILCSLWNMKFCNWSSVLILNVKLFLFWNYMTMSYHIQTNSGFG